MCVFVLAWARAARGARTRAHAHARARLGTSVGRAEEAHHDDVEAEVVGKLHQKHPLVVLRRRVDHLARETESYKLQVTSYKLQVTSRRGDHLADVALPQPLVEGANL